MSSQNAVTVDRVAEHYDRMATLSGDLAAEGCAIHLGYWEEDGRGTLREAMDRITDLVLARTGLRAGERLLDVGCGYGQPARRAAREHGADVTGITNSAAQRDIAVRDAGREGPGGTGRLRFDLGDAMRLPYPDASFDAAWAVESLLHMPDPGAVLAGIRRVLAPSGRLVLADIVERSPMPPAARRLCRESLYSTPHAAEELPGTLRAAGFEVARSEDLSDRVRHTWPALAEAFEQYLGQAAEPPSGSGPRPRRDMTEQQAATARRMADGLTAMGAVFDDHLGYVLLVAEAGPSPKGGWPSEKDDDVDRR